MSQARTAELVASAGQNRTAVLAFNVITLEHAEGILAGAERAGRPVILQISENAIRYHAGSATALIAACSALIDEAAVPAALHLDHITDIALLSFAEPSKGVESVMFDASELPYADNLRQTRWVSDELHGRSLWVEAELGAVGGKKGAHHPGVRTEPVEATDFVARTRVDALAIAVGSSHAMTERTAVLDIDLIARIAAETPVPLVLHGSSGVSPEQLRAAASAGIAKINIGTALNVAFTGAIREVLGKDPAVTDPRRYLSVAREAVAVSVEDSLRQLPA
jgi:fructose-bisphosphate aldolase class II